VALRRESAAENVVSGQGQSRGQRQRNGTRRAGDEHFHEKLAAPFETWDFFTTDKKYVPQVNPAPINPQLLREHGVGLFQKAPLMIIIR
jgi:hypothetical protein